jgi:hypothetical protein
MSNEFLKKFKLAMCPQKSHKFGERFMFTSTITSDKYIMVR